MIVGFAEGVKSILLVRKSLVFLFNHKTKVIILLLK